VVTLVRAPAPSPPPPPPALPGSSPPASPEPAATPPRAAALRPQRRLLRGKPRARSPHAPALEGTAAPLPANVQAPSRPSPPSWRNSQSLAIFHSRCTVSEETF